MSASRVARGSHRRRRAAVLAALLCLCIGVTAFALELGAQPSFSLESTSGARRSVASYAGRVAIVMYEDRDSTEVNALLKAELRERIIRERRQQDVVVIPIADVHAYDYWPARAVVRRAVEKRARELGLEILLDWTADVARVFGFHSPGSNVALLSRKGLVLFRETTGKALDADGRRRFHEALTGALAAPAQPAAPSLPAPPAVVVPLEGPRS